MGNFMIPCCCVCGTASRKWHDEEWEDAGGLQDFCPECANSLRQKHGEFIECTAPHMVMEETDER